ncbi:hypothetical protein V3C99_018959 [Haemonchus contortus]
MQLFLPFLFILICKDLSAATPDSAEIDYDLVLENYTYNDGDAIVHSEIHEVFKHYRKCRADNEWSCDENCRLEFFEQTKKCRNPDPDDNCFGIPITYQYSRDFHLKRFPRELAVLSNYPKCWSHFAPLVCATMYRPCSRHFFIQKDKQGKVKNGTVELWQLLSASSCESVHQACGGLISAHILKAYTQCGTESAESTVFSRQVYSSACQYSSEQLPVSVKSGTCAWPLVSGQNHFIHQESSPVVDECFLPCRSPLVSHSLASRFRSARFIICLILTTIFVIESVYLSRFSNIFSESLLVFYISHAMISISVYFLVWSMPVFDYFFNLSECSIDGMSRQYAITHSTFEWCSLQSLILYASLTAAFIWLFALYTYAFCPPPLFECFLPKRLSTINVRSALVLSIYGFSMLLAMVMNNMRENDGVTGVCYNGLITWWKYFISMSPFLCMLFIVSFLGLFVVSRKDGLLKAQASREAIRVLNIAEESEFRKRCNAAKRNDRTEEATSSVECELGSDERETLSMHVLSAGSDGGQKPVRIKSDWKETYNGLLSKDFLQGLFDQEFSKHYHFLQDRLAYCNKSELPRWWSVVSFGFATLFLLAAPVIHKRYTSFDSQDHEARIIAEYIHCGTAYAISNRSIEWSANHTWPSPAIANAPWCSLSLGRARTRLEGVLIVFVLLPALPFLILFIAFVAGLNGYDGMILVRRNHDDVKDPVKGWEEGENFHLLPVEQKQNVEKSPSHLESGEPCDVKAGVSPVHETVNDFSRNVLDETVAEDESSSNSNTAEEQITCIEVEQKDENQKIWDIVSQLRGELAFQQSMLVNDSAAWNISLHFMRKTEQILLNVIAQGSPTSAAAAQDLRLLAEEMSRVLPTVSDHAVQLSRWMQSVQEASVKLEHIQEPSPRYTVSHCYLGAQDIYRQQNLLALHNYLLTCQTNNCQQATCSVYQENAATAAQQEANPNSGPAVVEEACPSQVEQEQQCRPVEQAVPAAVPHCDAQPGTSGGQQPNVENRPVPDSPERPARPLPNGVVRENEQPSGSQGPQPEAQPAQRVPRISAYAISYSATPSGFVSRLTVPELRIRIEQIRNICAGDVLYPQELTYMLLASGDVLYGGNQPRDGFYYYTAEQMPELFGARVPTIDARIGVQAFLAHMRRRALTVVGAVGYHFSLRPRRGTDYTPPVLPPLGLYRSENELILRRVLGDRDDILPSLRDFLREYNFGRGPIGPRPTLKYASAFRKYLVMVAVREGFNGEDLDDYVPDPVPPAEPTNGEHENAHESSAEDSDPPAPS